MASSDSSQPRKPFLPIFFGIVLGAATGFGIGTLIVRELPGGIFAAIGGALAGGAMGSGIIGTTGWTMIFGAFVGGFLAIALTGFGKAAIYGAPWGLLLGLGVGLAVEGRTERSPRLRRLLKWLAAVAAIGCLAFLVVIFSRPAFVSSGPKLRDTFSSDGISILREATKVEVFRVLPDKPDQPPEKEIGGYPITAVGKEQGSAFAKRLSAVLLGDGVAQNQKKCGLQPGMAFRIWEGMKAVEVLVCFECDVLWPYVVGETSDQPWFQWQDFDPVRGELIGLAKEAFPEDKEIQGLSRRR